MKKCVVTVVGPDNVGIIAKVCTYFAENGINILDISETIVSKYLNMMMLVDLKESPKTLELISEELKVLGEGIGVLVNIQREEIFDMMHRI